MNMPKFRGLHAKIPSPKAIFIGFLLVTVKVLNSYVVFIIQQPTGFSLHDRPDFLYMKKRRPSEDKPA